MEHPNEYIMLVRCTEEEFGIKEGELCWCLTEDRGPDEPLAYKVLVNNSDNFIHCAHDGLLEENYEIVTELVEIPFETKQRWVYPRGQKNRDMYPASFELFEQVKQQYGRKEI